MTQQQSNKSVLWLIPLCAALMLFAGCDKYQRYEVLTFWFTGVPHPDAPPPVEEESGFSPEDLLRKRKEDIVISAYSHGPYGAQQCYQCHTTSQSATFRTSAAQGTSVVKSGPNVSGRLVQPIKELCIDCHTTKSVASAFVQGLWVHGPVSEGICVVCHSPHASPYPYLLIKGNSREMCIGCHAEGFIMETEDHQKDEDCTSCHNPHVGKNRYLLKKDLNESAFN